MSARDMREAAWALFLLGTEHGGDPGTFDRDSAEIRASWDRVFEKAWIASPLRRPRADDDAREERLKAAESQAKVCREDAEINATRAEKADAEVRRLSTRLRTIAQRIIERVGADGPEIAEDALTRLFARIDAEAGGGK